MAAQIDKNWPGQFIEVAMTLATRKVKRSLLVQIFFQGLQVKILSLQL